MLRKWLEPLAVLICTAWILVRILVGAIKVTALTAIGVAVMLGIALWFLIRGLQND